MSPFQLMLCRQIRPTVPTLESKLQPEWPDLRRVRQSDAKTKQSYKRAYDSRHDVRLLPELEPGISVAVKLDNERGWTKKAQVLQQGYIWSRQTGVYCAGTVATYGPSCLLQRLQAGLVTVMHVDFTIWYSLHDVS